MAHILMKAAIVTSVSTQLLGQNEIVIWQSLILPLMSDSWKDLRTVSNATANRQKEQGGGQKIIHPQNKETD